MGGSSQWRRIPGSAASRPEAPANVLCEDGPLLPMRILRLDREISLPRDLEPVFDFFADPGNLEAITPPWLHFRILGVSDRVVREGTTIDYALRLRGVPIRWRSLISSWNPPYSFVDEQVRGPYRLWRHLHEFEATADGSVSRDHVDYAVPGGALVDRLFVRGELERIFDYRSQRLAELLGTESEPAPRDRASGSASGAKESVNRLEHSIHEPF